MAETTCPNPAECTRDIQRNTDCINILKTRVGEMVPRKAFFSTISIVVVLIGLVLAAMGRTVSNLHDDLKDQKTEIVIETRQLELELKGLNARKLAENAAQDKIVQILSSRVDRIDVLIPIVTDSTKENSKTLREMYQKLEQIRLLIEYQNREEERKEFSLKQR